MIARDLVTGLEVGQDRERALEVGQEVVRVERDLRLLWMGGHDCSSVTVLGCALLGAIHPCGAAPALTAVSWRARLRERAFATRVAWGHGHHGTPMPRTLRRRASRRPGGPGQRSREPPSKGPCWRRSLLWARAPRSSR